MKRARHDRPILPTVTLPEARKLADGRCYCPTAVWAGQTLIALKEPPIKARKPRIIVRNCYGRGGGVTVENMREYLKGGARWNAGNRGVPLARLQHLGYTVYRGPFKVREPAPNFMAELDVIEFEAAWQAAQRSDDRPTLAEIYHFGLTTPTMKLIDLHWRERKVREGWTQERVRKLCALWKLTPHELAHLIQWPAGSMEGFLNGRGVDVPGPVCVWFYFLENVRLGVDVFPNLQPPVSKAS